MTSFRVLSAGFWSLPLHGFRLPFERPGLTANPGRADGESWVYLSAQSTADPELQMPVRSTRATAALLTAAFVNLASAASPPATEKQTVTDTFFGVSVSDPYRWLEDNASAKGREWNEAQNAYTHAYLDALPVREALKARLTTMIKAT